MKEIDSNIPSRLAVTFLLVSGAEVFLPKIPTYMIIFPLINVFIKNQLDTSKLYFLKTKLKFHLNIISLYTVFHLSKKIPKHSRILFAVPDIENNNIGTQFTEKHVHENNIHVSTKNFEYSLKIPPRNDCCITLIEKSFHFFFYQINSKKQFTSEPIIYKICIFRWEKNQKLH